MDQFGTRAALGPSPPARALSPIRLLTFTTLYPNAAQPTHGIFVENRLRHLVAGGGATSTVLAPVAFGPRDVIGRGNGRAKIPGRETRHGLTVFHPRFASIPKLGMIVSPWLLHATAAAALRRLQRQGFVFDLIDAHYFYPDGVAAVRLARTLRLPVVVTARGSDLTQWPDFAIPRRLIRWAISRADFLIAVSAALAERLVSLGAAPDRVRVLRNGVDLDLFRPAERGAARIACGIDGPTLLSVGHLIARKGHDRVIAALPLLPGTSLIVVGEGPLHANLAALAERLGVASRVRFLGSLPHAALPTLYSAADALVLASSREGWANVLLEAMACGTPVVASPIPGNPEVVQSAEAGLIAPANTPEGIAEAVRAVLDHSPPRAATRAYAERFGWDETSSGQLDVFRRVLGAS
jgi:teichuronic acid biosynthesis glycosyltransferase TuaC